MKKKRLENNPEVQKRLEENETIEQKRFDDLLDKMIQSESKNSTVKK